MAAIPVPMSDSVVRASGGQSGDAAARVALRAVGLTRFGEVGRYDESETDHLKAATVVHRLGRGRSTGNIESNERGKIMLRAIRSPSLVAAVTVLSATVGVTGNYLVDQWHWALAAALTTLVVALCALDILRLRKVPRDVIPLGSGDQSNPVRVRTGGLAVVALVAILAGSGVIGIARTVSSDPPKTKGTIELTLKPAEGNERPTAELLNQTAAILRTRLASADIRPATVTATNDTIVMMVPPDRFDEARAASVRAALLVRPVKAGPFPIDGPGSGPGHAPSNTIDISAQYPGTTPAEAAELAALDCSKTSNEASTDKPNEVIAACAESPAGKLLLAPTIIEGTEIKDAAPTFDQQSLQGWTVLVDFKGAGSAVWADYTSKHNVTVTPNDIANKVAFTLDGRVVSYPEIQGTINGQTTITGQFDESSATDLANVLKHGALPLTLVQLSARTIN
jgi:hypothetical protein